MAVYSKLSMDQLHRLAGQFGLPEVEWIKAIEGGNSNTNHRLKTVDVIYVMTILEEKNIRQGAELVALLQHLAAHDFYTSTIILPVNGEPTGLIDEKPVLLKPWIDGEVVEQLEASQLRQIGRCLARLHQIPAPDFLPRVQAYGLQTFAEMIGQNLDRKYESWLGQQFKRISTLLNPELPRGFIHGDLFYDNVLFESGQLKAIIDFEESCHYYLIFDIGMAALGLCRNKTIIDLAGVKALVDGYLEVRDLTPLERTSLQLCIEYAATATSRWRYWKYNFDAPTESRKDIHWEMVGLALYVQGIEKPCFNAKVFA